MLDKSSVAIATNYWASHLGCRADALFAEPLRLIIHAGELADYPGVFGLFRDGAAVISIPADRADALRPLLSRLNRDSSPGALATALQPVASAIIGPAGIGYASGVTSPTHPTRDLNSSDAHALHTLQESCDPAEWEHGGSSAENPCSGVFFEDSLVAVASYEIWGGAIAHISVITHPDFRGRGFARSAVAHIAARALASGLISQYRTLESNRPSLRVGESLGFQPYARSLAIRLGDFS